MRTALAALFVIALGSAALAQQDNPRPYFPPATGESANQQGQKPDEKMTPKPFGGPDALFICHEREDALKRQAQILRDRIAALQAQINAAAPPSYVCKDRDTSQNSNGVTEDCAPYLCEQASGRCRSHALASTDCNAAFAYDARSGKCEDPCIAAGGAYDSKGQCRSPKQNLR